MANLQLTHGKILVIGKNSSLWIKHKSQIKRHFHKSTFLEISHSEIAEPIATQATPCAIIIFSISKKHSENIILFDKCVTSFKCPILIIGSASILSIHSASFRYSSIKKRQMNLSKSYSDALYAVFGIFESSKRKGLYYRSESESLVRSLRDLFEGERGVKNYFFIEGSEEPKYIKGIYSLLARLLGPVFTAALFKTFSDYHYGYTRVVR